MFSQVQTDKVPMPAPHGSVFDVAWTLQPSGTQFNPPARISLPNANGGKPGEEQEMFSFDHDLMEWVSIGPGVVSDDGSRITSREGFGVRHAGWGGAPPPPPPPTCNIKCNDGNECTSDSKNDCFCVNKLIPDKVKSDQTEGNCQTELCSGSRDNNGDIPPDSTEAGDCQISGCEDGSPTPVDDNGDKPRPEDNPDNFCKTCEDGGIVADAQKNDKFLPDEECKFCKDGLAKDVDINVAGIPTSMCIGEKKNLNITVEPKNLQINSRSVFGRLVLTQKSSGGYELEATAAGKIEDTIYMEYKSCFKEDYKIIVTPKVVNDLWGFALRGQPSKGDVNDAFDYSSQYCTSSKQNPINHDIDGCSGGIAQRITDHSNYIIASQFQIFDQFRAGREPIWGQDRGQTVASGGSDALACNSHDICYQTCGSSQTACDTQLRADIENTCDFAYENPCPYTDQSQCDDYKSELVDCYDIARNIQTGLSVFGAKAWKTRQVEFCTCCES